MTERITSKSEGLESLMGRLADEFQTRVARGERPDVEDYARRHPDLADVLRDILPALQAVQDAPTLTEGPPADTPALPPALGEFRIVRELGRGGMGIVYEAVQESLGRRVALKVLLPSARRDPLLVQRFRRETHTVARLHHTNIVPVFAVGEHDGVCFYAMQLIEGRPLDVVLEERRRPRAVGSPSSHTPGSAPYEEAVRLALQAAEGIAHAHAQGVLHRDIKPSNLLVDARGTLWVTDFGLARAEGLENLTETGTVLGTLRYMAPERFGGQADARSDVWALGATLYELLTLRPAFDDTDQARLIRRITQEGPSRPRYLDAALPRDLETICLKAMDRDPARRYPSAAALAGDLHLFLAGRPITARRAGVVERLARWAGRNPAIATLLTLVVAVFLAGFAGVLVQWRRAEVHRIAAVAERDRYEESFRDAQETVDELLTRFAEGLQDVPQTDPLREKLLEKALAKQRKFLAGRPDDPHQYLETARAYRRVGQLHDMLGRPSQAEEALTEAMALVEAADAPDRERNRERAHLLVRLGRVSFATGRALEAEETHFAEARKVLDQLLEDAPDDGALRYEAAQVCQVAGDVLVQASRYDTAEGLYRRCLDHLDHLPGEEMAPRVRHLRANALNSIGTVSVTRGQAEEGAKALRAANELWSRLVEEVPSGRDYRRMLAGNSRNLGIFFARPPRVRFLEAATYYAASIEQGERLVKDFPGVPLYQEDLADSHNALGVLYAQMSGTRGVFRHRAALGAAFTLPSGGVFAPAGLWVPPEEPLAEALRAYGKARDVQRGVVARFGGRPSHREGLARTLVNLGNAWLVLSEKESREEGLTRAASSLAEARSQFEGLVDQFRARAGYHSGLGLACLMQGGVAEARGQWDEALAFHTDSVKHQTEAAHRDDRNVAIRFQLGKARTMLARCLLHHGKQAEAMEQVTAAASAVGPARAELLRTLRTDPAFKPLETHPGFTKVMADLMAK